jgi:hypothetical protein
MKLLGYLAGCLYCLRQVILGKKTGLLHLAQALFCLDHWTLKVIFLMEDDSCRRYFCDCPLGSIFIELSSFDQQLVEVGHERSQICVFYFYLILDLPLLSQ